MHARTHACAFTYIHAYVCTYALGYAGERSYGAPSPAQVHLRALTHVELGRRRGSPRRARIAPALENRITEMGALRRGRLIRLRVRRDRLRFARKSRVENGAKPERRGNVCSPVRSGDVHTIEVNCHSNRKARAPRRGCLDRECVALTGT